VTTSPDRQNQSLGIAAIVLVVIIYAINFIVTRYSVLHGMGPLDLTALRYSVSGLILLPYVARLGFRDLGGIGWMRASVLAVLAGFPYMVIFFEGLSRAPAGHGAVLNPGVVPVVVFLGTVWLGEQRFSPTRAFSLVLIVVGLILVTGASFSIDRRVLVGDVLLLLSGIFWGLFTVFVKRWNLEPMQAAAIVSLISLMGVPIYLMFFYHGLSSVSIAHIVGQSLFQGVLISIISLYLVTYAVRNLGSQLTALFSPVIPVLTTLLAIPLLGETPTAMQWGGVAAVVGGMLSAAR
jgi:drug/metabolite transporter (DMT)-like permease